MAEIRVAENESSVFLVTLDRPEAKNAFDEPFIDAFCARLAEVSQRSPRAVVITGAGGVFCAGYDVNEIDPDQSVDAPLPDERLERVIRAVEAMPCPMIAAISGDAFGGGLDLALACDLRVAVPKARLAMTPCRLGLVYSPRGVSRFLSKLGPNLARRLFFSARPIAAEEAASAGVVELVDAAEALLPAALELAAQVAANAPLAVRGTRETFLALERSVVASTPAQALQMLQELRIRAFRSRDLREGLAAFAAKRKPDFRGE